MDALHAAREAMEWSEDTVLEQDGSLWFFAKAQAYAAIAQAEAAQRQAAALERIAAALEPSDLLREYERATTQGARTYHAQKEQS